MGLDMFLTRSKRVEGLSAKDYSQIDKSIPSRTEEGMDLGKLNPEIPKASELNESVIKRGTTWSSVLEQVGYWRKANHIHQWFVEQCQGGVDKCQLTEITKQRLETLLSACRLVLDNHEQASALLPTQGGFFFGSTDYDEYYFDDIRDTVKIIEEVLETTDFSTQIIFYQSSW